MGRPKMMEIKTELITKEVEEALSGDLVTLWNVFKTLEGDAEFMVQYNEVKYGINEIFDIRAIIEEDYEKKPAFKIVTIGRKLNLDINKFRNELDAREKIMKKCIRSLYNDDFDNQEEEDMEGYE